MIASLLFLAATLVSATDVPKYGPRLSVMRNDHAFIQQNLAPDYWTLIPFYWPQLTNTSCSLSSAVTVLNAIYSRRNLKAEDPLLTPESLLERVKNLTWKRQTKAQGSGVSLHRFEAHMKGALKALSLTGWNVKAVEVPEVNERIRKQVREDLSKNEKDSKSYIIANFLQGRVTGDPEGMVGHYAPIGAFDSTNNRVLILDPDRQFYEPYWTPLEDLLQAMATIDGERKTPRGYLLISEDLL